MGLLGKNGTGKTTTINILTGFLKPTSGECYLLGEPSHRLSPKAKSKVGLLLEGHVGYPYLTVDSTSAYYRALYPNWREDIYRDLVSRLRIAPGQRIGTMSNGQRSQVALSVLLAQDPDLLILDDFSLGLDPGYRRLFTDIMREFVSTSNKTVFMTSHIIQDMERLIDDCIIMDYGRILVQGPVRELMDKGRMYTLHADLPTLPGIPEILHPEWGEGKHSIHFCSLLPEGEVRSLLQQYLGGEIALTAESPTSLEELFIGLTGKY